MLVEFFIFGKDHKKFLLAPSCVLKINENLKFSKNKIFKKYKSNFLKLYRNIFRKNHVN